MKRGVEMGCSTPLFFGEIFEAAFCLYAYPGIILKGWTIVHSSLF
jgi:hypothetical protein